MRFTMARPEVSCHPETLLEGARTVVSAALCYYAPAPEPAAGEGRLPRYAWRDHYALLRERLDALGRRLGGVVPRARRREPSRRPRGRRALRRRVHRQEHDADHAHPRLVGRARDARHRRRARADAADRARLRQLHACCIDACPTDALDEPGVLDATRCLAYWTQTPGEMPDDVMDALEDRVYGCDICQDVCPWNRGVEKRRAGAELARRRAADGLARRLADPDGRDLVEELDRLYVPKNDARWLRRNALVALGNVGEAGRRGARDAVRRRPGARARARRPAGASRGSRSARG